MLQINLDRAGKRFNRAWVFRGLSAEIAAGEALVLLGANGSGKSTLLKMLSGSVSPSSGDISYQCDGEQLTPEQVYDKVSVAAPYVDLITEYNLEEHIAFHFRFKELVNGVQAREIPQLLNLNANKAKPLKQYSSGMLQRVKLGLAILSDTPLLLLDEPATNLDAEGIEWYNGLMNKHMENRTVVICSNRREEEYRLCKRELLMENYR